jgi:alkanesulfonate monooxygenase SsuD/methylene tetrahydromethanopterin reductase-like flavin-dependent oxidoreductase (luciferase family)
MPDTTPAAGSALPWFGLHLAGLTSAVDLATQARRAEQLGFDVVAVDRDVLSGPPPGLEVWTALTWAAASTTSIRVVPNVLALPYRHPALLAKMAESLDRLSGGRAVLALGAGAAMHDPILDALGLRRLSPAQRVAATSEALDVIRGLWSKPGLAYPGTHFTIHGADLQPRPATQLPIWLGAYGPRMLDLTGRRADGWVPSLFLLPPDAAYRALDRVRSAAARAGRRADDLTYAYNVGVWVDEHAPATPGQVVGAPDVVARQLAELVRHGFTCLNFWPRGNTVEQIERLAAEVIPAVRDQLR